MNRLGSLFGLTILIAGAYGVYILFHEPPAEGEEPEPAVATVVPVEVGVLERATLHGYIQAYGTVDLDPGDADLAPAAVLVTAPADSLIVEAHCALGMRIDKGDLLFRLDDRLLEVAAQKARQAVVFAEKEFARQEQLRKVEGTSDKLYLEARQRLDSAQTDLKAVETQLGFLEVRAPFAGTISAVNASEGATVALAQVLAELRDTHRVVVNAQVTSAEADALVLGQEAVITPSGAVENNEPLRGALIYMAPEIDPGTDTLPVRISLPPGAAPRPGTFVEARILYTVQEDCLAMDAEGVVTALGGETHIAVVEDGMARTVPVEAGLREGNLIEVRGAGLEAGMTVVTAGAYGLPEETKVRILNQ